MKVFYLIEDLGDGSATVRFYDSEDKAQADLEGDDSDYFAWNEYGDVYDPSWTADECDMAPEEHGALLAQPRCVVLYPTN